MTPRSEVRRHAERGAALARRLINRLRHVETLGKSAAREPKHCVANLKSGILEPRRHPVMHPGPAEHQDMPSWFQNPQGFSRPEPRPVLILVAGPSWLDVAAHVLDSSFQLFHPAVIRATVPPVPTGSLGPFDHGLAPYRIVLSLLCPKGILVEQGHKPLATGLVR